MTNNKSRAPAPEHDVDGPGSVRAIPHTRRRAIGAAGGWIKMEKSLEGDPRVRRMAREMRNANVTQGRFSNDDPYFSHAFFVSLVLGSLSKLWFYGDTHVRQDDTIEMGIDDVDEIVGVRGFAQVLPEDWLQILDTEAIKLPGFHTHNGTEAKKQAVTNKRVARYRERVTPESFNSESGSNADVTQTALPDKNRQEKKRSITDTPRATRSASTTAEFSEFKSAYPSRAGDPGWSRAAKAANARIKEGHTWEEMIAGAKRYAAFVRSTGNENTEYVKQASTFLGIDKHFLLPWDPPAPKKNGAHAVSAAATQAWKDLLESRGVKRDARVQAVLAKIGGYQRIQQRTDFEAPKLEREFCRAYDEAAAA